MGVPKRAAAVTRSELRDAALALVDAEEALRDAINGQGHLGENHDDWLAPGGHPMGDGVVMHDIVGDCSACGGAQYGAEDNKTRAYARLRVALGLPLRPWEKFA